MTTRYRRCMWSKPYLRARLLFQSSLEGDLRTWIDLTPSSGSIWSARLDSGSSIGSDQRMASRKGDARVLVLATLAVLVFGLVVAALILFITGRAKTPEIKGAIPFGYAKSIRQKAIDGGPFAYAGNSGDDGFWIAIEDGKLVALKIQKPGTADCNVIWRGSKNTFKDCNNDSIRIDQLARYPVDVPTKGKHKGLLMVDLSTTIPPPAGS